MNADLTASRRRFLIVGASVLAASIPKTAQSDARFSQRISLYNVHTKESVDTTFWDGRKFVSDAVSEINWLLRDWRTGQAISMDLRLLLILRSVSTKVRAEVPFHVISAFRSKSTNMRLHKDDPEGVPEQSYHMHGMAIDIRLPGYSTEDLRNAALWATNGNGGVGYYPRSDFIHIDTGRITRAW